MKVKSYIDNYYYIFFGIYFVLCFVMTVIIAVLDVNKTYLLISVGLFIVLALLWYFFYYRSYNFARKYFYIKIGCFTKKFLYEDITKCYMTKNNIPSYATSYERICVEFKDKKIYISPCKMEKALATLIKNSAPKKTVTKKKTPKKMQSKK